MPSRRRRARRRAAAAPLLGATLTLTLFGSAHSAATRIISTVAGDGSNGGAGSNGDGGQATAAKVASPVGQAIDADGNLYITESTLHRVRKVATDGTITTFAGTGTAGSGGDGGAATSAQVSQPRDVAVDAAGKVYIADTGNRKVRVVSTSGTITTFAGTGAQGSSGNGGAATSATFQDVRGVAVDGAGNVLISDASGHAVRKVNTSGTITAFAGTGTGGYSGDGGAATSAQLRSPVDVAFDPSGNAYIADRTNNRIRKVTAGGTISTFAGTGSSGYSGDGGAATSATLRAPGGVAAGANGRVAISDGGNHAIRFVATSGTISTIAGDGSAGFAGDGGDASEAELDTPARAAFDGTALVFADSGNHRVRRITNVAVPTAPTVSQVTPASPANDNAPMVSGSAESGSTVTLYTDSACTSEVAATGTSSAFASPGLAVSVADDTSTTFYATATDGTGAVSDCSTTSVTYVEDSTPPSAPTISGGPGTTGNDATPTWTFSGSGTLQCRLDRGGSVVSNWATCSSPKSYDISEQPDGTFTFRVRVVDTAGNQSSEATATYLLDRGAPAAPSISASEASPATTRSPQWSFDGIEAGATAECALYRGVNQVVGYATCTSPKTFDMTGYADDTYTFLVRARDAAGNTGSGASASYTLDTTPPGTPSLTASPASPGSGRSPAWSFTDVSNVTEECRLERGGTTLAAFAACTSPKSYSLTGEPDGVYTFSVRTRDSAGNQSLVTAQYELDTTAPAQPTFTSEPPATSFDTTPTWGLSGDSDARLECRLSRAGAEVLAYATCTSPKTYDLSSRPDGLYQIDVRAVDAAGNTSTVASDTYLLDTSSATTPTITATPGALGSGASPQWGFTAPGSAGFECKLARGSVVVSDFSACSSPKSFVLTSEADGSYTFSVRGLDSFGRSGPSASDTYALDRTAPVAPVIESGPPAASSAASAAWSFSGEAGASLECRLVRGDTVISNWAGCATPKGYDMTGQPDGTYAFGVRAIDGAGNVGAVATGSYRRDTVAETPQITKTAGTIGRDPTPAWRFAAAESGSLNCELRRGSTTVALQSGCSSPWSPDLADERDGSYTFLLRAVDEAGNTSASVSDAYRLDRVAPDAPAITSGPSSPGRDTSPAFRFASDEAAFFECALLRGTRVVREWTRCDSPRDYNIHAEPDGEYTFRVRATDAAGNTGDPARQSYTLATATVEGGAAPAPAAPAPPPAPPAAPAPPMPPEEPAPAPEDEPAAAEEGDVAGENAAGAAAAARASRAAIGAPAGTAAADAEAVLRAGRDAQARAEEENRRGKRKKMREKAVRVLKNVGQAAEVVGEKTAFPVALLVVVVFFLGLQDRIDRNDPKLALAPVFSDPDLSFERPELAGVPAAPALAAAGHPPPP